MNEPEILEAYSRLSKPVSAPPDVLEQVERRITRRRRTRRRVVVVAALAVVGGVGVTAIGGDDGDGSDRVAADPGRGETSSLTYTNTDGSTYTFDAKDIDVACTKDGHLFLARNMSADAVRAGRGPLDLPEDELILPVLFVDLDVDRIEPGQTFDLPYDSRSGDSDERSMTFFFTAGEELEGSNELSSAEPGSSGTVTVHEATCGPAPSLWVEIDGTLGSEEQQAPLAITGEYRS